MTKPATIVQRLWNYCHVLRDDGVSYGDYVEQLTYLLFLKLTAGREQSAIPPALGWDSLLGCQGEALKEHYGRVLRQLGQGAGLIGIIFGRAQNKIQDPARLRRVIELIDGQNWNELDMDLKGAIYEGLLEKNAQDVRSGAGQYFTPRPLIQAMVNVLRPGPGQRICDPAAGTGGFLLAAHAYVLRHHSLDRQQRWHLQREALRGWEIVPNTARLCVMNLYLRGVGANGEAGLCPIHLGDALDADPGERFDLVLTNPPFGKKGSAAYARDDFWTQTTNKQLNFVQHVRTILKTGGRAAIVVPDNVLFEGGAGETVRRKLLAECDVHTLLRLPTGIFYAPGVKANVLFFDRCAGTRTLWVYDLRTNKSFTPKQSPLARADLDEFVACYNPGGERTPTWSEHSPQGRWRAFGYEELLARDKANLDVFWLRDESLPHPAGLPAPGVLAEEIVQDLEAALEQFKALAGDLGGGLESKGCSRGGEK